jgi:hypothetical protein
LFEAFHGGKGRGKERGGLLEGSSARCSSGSVLCYVLCMEEEEVERRRRREEREKKRREGKKKRENFPNLEILRKNKR